MHLLVVISVVAACTSKKPQYDITGKIKDADNVTFLLQKREAGKIVTLDSAIEKNEEFIIKGGSVEYPQLVTLLAKDRRIWKQFYLENSEITITGRLDSLNDAKVTGSKAEAESDGLRETLKPYNIKYSQVLKDRKNAEDAGDKVKVAELSRELDEIDNQMTEIQKDFLKKNPGSYISPAVLHGLSYEMEAGEIESYINAMDTNIAKVTMIKGLKERIAILKTVSVGRKAPDFTMNDVNGKPVTLSLMTGSKLLLIDFWAAWCGYCRAENPNVVNVYNEYHKKGFNIIGVSLDMKKEDWLKAIKDDKLTWTHVSDLQYWNNSVARLYAVNSIPANFLIDDKGIIIARNLRGDALNKKVKEILTATKE